MTTETILIVAEHPHIANLWMHVNIAAIQSSDVDVRVITGLDIRSSSLGPAFDRLIVVGHPDRDVVDRALLATKHGPDRVLRVQHSDRLAAGWRTG